MTPTSGVFQDYDIHTAGREDYLHGAVRRHLKASGVKVECSKGEACWGQHEINVVYSGALNMADTHLSIKSCVRDVAHSFGHTATFMAKPFEDYIGSSCHIHINLTNPDGTNAFYDPEAKTPVAGASKTFQSFLGGLLKYTPDFFAFMAPNPNSYKRFQKASWAPIKLG